MSYNLESKGYLPAWRMDRKDIALVILAAVVCILGIGVIYSLARDTDPGLTQMENKLKKQQEQVDKNQAMITTLFQQQHQKAQRLTKNTTTTLPAVDDINNQLRKQQEQIDKQQTSIASLHQQQHIPTTKGVVYVRWGRMDCPGNTTELVYSGFAGGSHYSNTGAAAEYVCLPPDPSWGPKQDIRTQRPGFMYGAEYEDDILFNVKDRKRDVPCAVCRSSSQSTSIMIPARSTCYPGWDEAYHGYLASGYYKQAAASQYVCVDQEPQTLVGGGSSNDEGKLFFQVRAKCGSLKCPPYEDDKVLSCVVCMK